MWIKINNKPINIFDIKEISEIKKYSVVVSEICNYNSYRFKIILKSGKVINSSDYKSYEEANLMQESLISKLNSLEDSIPNIKI